MPCITLNDAELCIRRLPAAKDRLRRCWMTPSRQAPLKADLTTESRRVCRTPVSYDDPSSSTVAAAAHDLASGAISLPREHLDHSMGDIPDQSGVVDLYRSRCSTTRGRRAYQTRILDDAQSSGSLVGGCYTVISRRVRLRGMFDDIASASTRSSVLCCPISSSTWPGRVLRHCATRYGVL
jgi:hypothetical protein